MALWQFLVFTVLIAALLVYASVLTRRVGCTNARLKTIEEALLELDRLVRHANTRSGEATPPSEVSSKDGRATYLTIRDLKARSELMNSRATHSSNENSIAQEVRGVPVPVGFPMTHSVAMSLEARGPVETRSEPSSSPSTAADEEAIAKRERDALFIILSSQRRRRRAREGY